MKNLFLDDERIPGDVTWVNIGNFTWNIVRSVEDAKAWVLANGFPDRISFDHDLADLHYSGDYSDEKTGYDFAKWLVEHDMDTQTMPRHFEYTVHSKNPIGGSNIYLYLLNYMRSKGFR